MRVSNFFSLDLFVVVKKDRYAVAAYVEHGTYEEKVSDNFSADCTKDCIGLRSLSLVEYVSYVDVDVYMPLQSDASVIQTLSDMPPATGEELTCRSHLA